LWTNCAILFSQPRIFFFNNEKVSVKKKKKKIKMVYGLGILEENLFAVSMTADPPDRIDLPAVWRPWRTLGILVFFPFLAHPIALLHGIGVARCLWTFQRPISTNIPKYEDKTTPEYVVYKRVYDEVRQKILETHILNESGEVATALKVVGKKRGEFVEDHAVKGVSYFVQERMTLNKSYMFRREKWAWSVVSDLTRYVFPFTLTFMFFPAARRFNTDILLWWKGQLPRWDIRHPIPNFFLSVNDYNKAKHRVTMKSNLMPVSAKPWTPINTK
jgi:hypothetical protein